MSKSTWSYRLARPPQMLPPANSMMRTKTGPTSYKWNEHNMTNYEHVKGKVTNMPKLHDVVSSRKKYLKNIELEIQAGRPLWALDIIQRMLYEDCIPEGVHYRAVLNGSVLWNEPQTARDCWALLERQDTVPDSTTLCCYLEVCSKFKWKDDLLKTWNRYCNEFQFLSEGEIDPKPISRKKHTLTRDDHYSLPWWRKRWDFDPKHDVIDHHRYNTTRELYAAVISGLGACGEIEVALDMFGYLKEKLLTTPTPVGEPLADPQLAKSCGGDLEKKPIRYQIPDIYLFSLQRQTRGVDWIPNHEWLLMPHQAGPATSQTNASAHNSVRFFSNEQYLLHAKGKLIASLAVAGHFKDADQVFSFIAEDLELVRQNNSDSSKNPLDCSELMTAALHAASSASATSQQVHELLHQNCEEYELCPTPSMYQAVFASSQNPDSKDGEFIKEAIREMGKLRCTLDLETHTEAMRALAACFPGTLETQNYFVRNVLRKFYWDNTQINILLKTYREIGDQDANLQKKLCERAVIWCHRYNIQMDETNKHFIEDDYARIKVQVRTKEELVEWKMKRQHELRNKLLPTMPNPVTDRVTHTLDVSDRDDPDHMNKWFVPFSNAGRTHTWNFSSPHVPEAATTVRDLTDVDRVRYLPQQTISSKWMTKTNASSPLPMYRPERANERLNINRWLEETNKSFPGN
eukprot:TRINITY_DN4343_c0_g1_i1.p1 TRINITY_DN4343_c0_g1~~TRINITY_DN4343_c0_g1_i1.p1  ORF type:complete len:688 (+),score=113.99 TRINITY_DN4343_c0_g1_i1:352-2415(+)